MSNRDVEQFVYNLRNKLSNTPDNLKLKTIKDALNTIQDPSQKSLAESLLDIVTNVVGLPSNIVVLIHGIRTYAQWQELLKSELESKDTKAFTIGYGYFDAFRFWFPFVFRRFPINKVKQQLRNIQTNHPKDKIIVVAHSYGTYVISKIISDEPDIKVHRLLLCGSIIKNSFRWDKLARLPQGGIINDCGTKDIWPVLAKSLSWGYGSSGRFGFQTSEVENRYHNLGHSDFFEIEFMRQFWLPFLLNGECIKSDWNKQIPNPPILIKFFDILPTSNLILFGTPIIMYRNELVMILKNLF